MRGSGRSVWSVAAVALVVAALAVAGLTARSGRTETLRPITTAVPVTPPAPTASAAYQQPDAGPSARPNTPPDPPLEIGLLVLVVMLAVLLGLGLFLWIVVQRIQMRTGVHGRRRAPLPDRLPPGPAVGADPAVLADAVAAGLRDLADGDPGEGVIACWVQLERAAAEAGAERAAPETPSELAGRLIDMHGVQPGPLVRLAELYREARYSTHPVPESARTEARSMLEEVRADLALAAAAAGWSGRPAPHPPVRAGGHR